MKSFRLHKRKLAYVLLLSFALQLFLPVSSFAIDGHKDMPEYRSFESVTTSNMVNLFDGSLTYNIDLLNIPNGCPIGLSYHSGDVNNEALASWVGLGWTLNPGAINVMKNGVPDQFNKVPVTYHHRMPKNWTISAETGANAEILGKENSLKGLISGGLKASIRFNNNNGVGYSVSAPFTLAGGLNLDFNYSGGRFGFNPDINPAGFIYAIVNNRNARKAAKAEKQLLSEANEDLESCDVEKVCDAKKKMESHYTRKFEGSSSSSFISQVNFSYGGFGYGGGSFFSHLSMLPASYPTTNSAYTGMDVHMKFAVGVDFLPFPMDFEGEVAGGLSIQSYEAGTTRYVYGYMFNEKALEAGEEGSIMDFTTENDSPYEKRDNILGFPVPNHDTYSVSGEGLGGSFRAFRSEYGHYRQNYSISESNSISISGDINLPSIVSTPPIVVNAEMTGGGEVGGSYSYTSIKDWDDWKINDVSKQMKFGSGDENWFFRFSNDLAGNFDLTGNDAPYKPELDKNILLNAETNYANYKGQIKSTNNRKRSSYVRHVTQREAAHSSNGFRYKMAEQNLHFLDAFGATKKYQYDDFQKVTNQDAIVELSTHSADGIRYVYGLPVYTRNEKQLSYSLNPGEYGFSNKPDNAGGTDQKMGTIAYINSTGDAANIDVNAKRKQGYECATAYSTTHLLTSICSPDYIDRHMDGPTRDDFGSFTKITYQRKAGGDTPWYPYRSPHEGLDFSYGSLSDNRDDMGSFSYGEKELYYVKSIASKTHVAIFTTSDREDGKSVALSTGNSPSNANALIKGSDGAAKMKLQKLDKIDLYSIEDMQEWRETPGGPAYLTDVQTPLTSGDHYTGIYVPKTGALPITTVHFTYNYSLCKGVPNNNNSDVNDNGKLTLLSVHYEHLGKQTSKISPYKFHYEYPKSTGADPVVYPAEYAALNDYGAGKNENPNYNQMCTDRWGNYRDYVGMANKFSNPNLARFFPFVDQNPNANFDPAAWRLKRIVLPSGGEIHIQYEQSDYQFVQNEAAMVMVPLSPSTDIGEEKSDVEDKKYRLNLDVIGINGFLGMSFNERRALVDQLFTPMRDRKDRMFFNFLYRLVGKDTELPDYTKTHSDYLEGYARIDGYGFDAQGPYFTFKSDQGFIANNSTNEYYTNIEYDTKVSKRELPRKVCKDFYNAQRRGLVTGESNALVGAVDGNKKGKEIADAFLSMLKSALSLNECKTFDPEMSYVRLQLPFMRAKFGGPPRARRLLMYEPGMPNADATLYGMEYSYKTTTPDGQVISSGVATNEPSMGRRENPLVKPIDKDAQTWYQAILFGRDMYSQEGPLGESFMPGPSVGYAKVTINSIHKGQTSTGSEEHEFYTCRDFPFNAKDPRTPIEEAFKDKIGAGAPIPAGPVGINISYNRQNPFMAQGYSFIDYGLHGQRKRSAKFAVGSKNAMAEEIYEYFKPYEMVGMMNENLQVTQVPVSYFGKESEILSERRQVSNVSFGGSVGLDVTGGITVVGIPPTSIPLTIPYKTKVKVGISIDEKKLHTHVTTKIVRYPAIVKRVTNINDGVRNISENLVLDKFTGSPVVVRTYDDFNSMYLNHDYMASYGHKNMRPKALNEKMVVNAPFSYNSVTGEGALDFSSFRSFACLEMSKLVEGDFVELKQPNTSSESSAFIGLYHVKGFDIANNKVLLEKSGMDNGTLNSDQQSVQICIVSSGYTNQLSAKQGNIMTHGKNIQPISYNVKYDPATEQFLNQLNQQLQLFIANKSNLEFTFTPPPGTKLKIGLAVHGGSCSEVDQINVKLTKSMFETNNHSCNTNVNNNILQLFEIAIKTNIIDELGAWNVSFGLSDNVLSLFYGGNACSVWKSCVKLCPEIMPIPNVIGATAVTYSDQWSYSDNLYPFNAAYNGFMNPDNIEKGKVGKWRPSMQFVYRENINQLTAQHPSPDPEGLPFKNFNEGKFDLQMFDWSNPANSNSKWVMTSKTNIYTPNGEAQEDENALGIRSTAKFGYNHTLPICIAQNASDHNVIFESFENTYHDEANAGTKVFEDHLVYNPLLGSLSTKVSHTGKYSVALKQNSSFPVGYIDVKNATSSATKGVILRVWLNTASGQSPANGAVQAIAGGVSVPLNLVSQAGKWSLYEAAFTPPMGATAIAISSSLPNVYMDDVRVQPKESEMVCYVYDSSQRLSAVLDDQHFAMIYEYNAKGDLVRKLKETTKGVKTVSETQYNSKGVLR